MLKELGIGMIGYGFMGKMHTYAYMSIPFCYSPPFAKIRLVGVCTAHEETAQEAIEQSGYEFGTTDYRKLLERDDIHIINCCVPNYLHSDIIIDAVNAGKHIYCENPMAMNLSEAREMLEAAEKAGVVHQVTFHNRFSPAMLRAKQLVDEGFLGQPMSFRVAYLHSGYIDPNRPMSWRLDKKQGGGGALYDLGSHAIDLIRYLLGDCTKVFASLHTFIKKRPVKSNGETMYAKVEVDDLAILQMNMQKATHDFVLAQNGAVGTMEASRIATGSTDELLIDIHGTQGALHFNLMDPNWLYAYDARAEAEPLGGMQGYTRIQTVQKYPQPAVFPSSKASIGWMRLHVASLYDFVTNVARGEVGSPSFLDGVKTQEIMEAALISAEQERWIDLPLG